MDKEDNEKFLFNLVHMGIFEIAKNRLRTKIIENLLIEKGIFTSNELEEKWNSRLKEDLPILFKKIEKNLGFENIRLAFTENGYIEIVGLPKDKE